MTDFIVKHRVWFLFALLLLLVYFPLFLHLDFLPLQMWDESIMGVNAIEMADNHNYIVTHYFGDPDMSNCKPPLMIWCVVAFSKVFGFNELSLRLPSAIAALILCIYLFWALHKYTGSFIYPFLVVVVLVTCHGYVRHHVTRTGEYDSLLVLFSTLAALQLFFAVEAREAKEQSRNLLLCFVFLTLAVLTKGVAPLMQAPGLFLYVVFKRKLVTFLRNKSLYIGLAIFTVFGLGYYFLRESMNPGYLQAVWDNELGGRFGSALDNHSGGPLVYAEALVNDLFTGYIYLLPVALLVGLKFSETPVRRLVLFAFVVGCSFFIIVSIAQTKLTHYTAPVFPYLAIITASLLSFIYSSARQKLNTSFSQAMATGVSALLVLSLLFVPYKNTLQSVYFPKGDWWNDWFEKRCVFFQNAVRNEQYLYGGKILIGGAMGTAQVLRCYERELREHGTLVKFMMEGDVKPGDTLVVFNEDIQTRIQQQHKADIIHVIDYCEAKVLVVRESPLTAKN